MVDIIPIPAFQDNYIWCISDGRHAAVVDPGRNVTSTNSAASSAVAISG